MPEETMNKETITMTQDQLENLMQRIRSDAVATRTPSWLRSTGRYMGARLTEPSTYAGIALAASAFGAHIDPDKFQAVSQLGAILAGGILAVSRDAGSSV